MSATDKPNQISKCAIRIVVVSAILATVLFTFRIVGGQQSSILSYVCDGVHIVTARALMNFQLYWNKILALGIPHDAQFYNGMVFPHSGYGVAFLQLPFHFVWNLFSVGDWQPFPDRAIFLFYLISTVLFIFFTFKKIVAGLKLSEWQNEWLCGSLTIFVLLYVISDTYFRSFWVYEANIAYMLLASIVALCSILCFFIDQQNRWIVIAALASGLALLIRPTSLLFAASLLAILLFSKSSQRSSVGIQRRHPAVVYILCGLPFLFLFLFFNYYRAGNILSLGFENVLPLIREFHVYRFGENPCFRSISDYAALAGAILRVIFVPSFGASLSSEDYLPASLQQCYQIFDVKPPFSAPMIPPLFTLLTIYCLSRLYQIKQRVDVSVFICAPLILILSYTWQTNGFPYRYKSDLAPYMLGILLFAIHHDSRAGMYMRRYANWISICLCAASAVFLIREVHPIVSMPTCIAKSVGEIQFPPAYFEREESGYLLTSWLDKTSRPVRGQEIHNLQSVPVQSTRRCQELGHPSLAKDKVGWFWDCSTMSMVHFYMALPPGESNELHLQLITNSQQRHEVAVQVNGEVFKGFLEGETSTIPIRVQRQRLSSPMVSVAFRVEKSFSKTNLKLFEVSLVQ